MTPEQLQSRLADHNPVDRLAALAQAGVPLFAIHGDSDKVVPLEANSGLVKERYTALGGTMQLVVPPGQGHNMWQGFFQCRRTRRFRHRARETMIHAFQHASGERTSSNDRGTRGSIPWSFWASTDRSSLRQS